MPDGYCALRATAYHSSHPRSLSILARHISENSVLTPFFCHGFRIGSSGSGAQQTGIAQPVLNIAKESASRIVVVLMKFIVLFLTV